MCTIAARTSACHCLGKYNTLAVTEKDIAAAIPNLNAQTLLSVQRSGNLRGIIQSQNRHTRPALSKKGKIERTPPSRVFEKSSVDG
jgi:hypothetical protein